MDASFRWFSMAPPWHINAVRGRPPHHWQTTTFLCALRHDRLVAPLALNGAIDGASFLAWVEQFLAPTLLPGDIVAAGNLNSHKVAGVRQAIEARAASLWFLPSYSPDLNPIELLFSKLKRLLRSTAARTVDALWHAIGQLLNHFDPAECASYLRHCGYPYSGR
jgi:transposase